MDGEKKNDEYKWSKITYSTSSMIDVICTVFLSLSLRLFVTL